MDNDISVYYKGTQIDDATILVTSDADMSDMEEISARMLRSAMEKYPENGQHSAVTTENTTTQSLTIDNINTLASGLNSNHTNLLTVNALIAQRVLSDGFLGRAYEAIATNVNTDYRLIYGRKLEDGNGDALQEVKDAIDYFNSAVNLKRLIRNAIPGTYLEGNYPLCLRLKKNAKPVIDYYPLTICYPSDYLYEGSSVLEFSVDNLKSRLQKTYKKTKKNKAVYFENIQKEVDENYPVEISKAYKDGEKYVRLDPKFSGCVKINDMGKKFGVSPLFRCLKPLIVLEQIETADVSDSKARSKKIIFQKLRKEVMGSNGERKGFEFAAHAHQQAAAAIKTNFGLYTAIPAVEDVSYVQPKAQTEDSVNQQKQYTQKLLTALGIGFADNSVSVGAGSISVGQLLKIINIIGESLEDVIYKFYRAYLEDCGLDPELAPTIKIIDAEQMEMDLKKDLAQFIYGTLNGSLETAFDIVGYDIHDEYEKRKAENEAGYDAVFYPRQTAYTANEKTPGRPSGGNNPDKQAYDDSYNDMGRTE